jgi:hypothetical protein
LGGEQHARYATKSHGAIAAKHRASEGETLVGSLTLGGPPAHLAATCALPTSTTATAVILSNVQDEPQSIRLATCFDRSAAASGAIASTVSPCLPPRKRLALAERLPVADRLALAERPRRRAAHRAGASRRRACAFHATAGGFKQAVGPPSTVGNWTELRLPPHRQQWSSVLKLPFAERKGHMSLRFHGCSNRSSCWLVSLRDCIGERGGRIGHHRARPDRTHFQSIRNPAHLPPRDPRPNCLRCTPNITLQLTASGKSLKPGAQDPGRRRHIVRC